MSSQPEHRTRMDEILAWWAKMDRWSEFTASYPQRFAVMLVNAAGSVSLSGTSFKFATPHGEREFTVTPPSHPTPDFKTLFEDTERHFASPPPTSSAPKRKAKNTKST